MTISHKLKQRYEIQEVLAKGGMGVVYRAFDGVMKRPVAVKTLLDMNDAAGLQLFQKECEDLASMTHPNIIEIYDVGQVEDDGASRPFLVMPLLPGVTLDKLIRASSPRLTVEGSIDIICQACRGLQAAHERGLIHRDIKPSNLFVMDDNSVKIIDFGVAHRAETSRTFGRKGTLLYMAPEQIEMKPLSPASDIFSLGVVCYETLTRRRPFERTTESSVADAILHFIPPPASALNPEVSQTLSQAVHKAMAKQSWHRYASAREFGDTLQRALRNEPVEIFSTARIRPRLQRAAETLERGDYQFASEIVGELEAEGHLDSAISELRIRIDQALRRSTVARLLETARTRIEDEEYPLALQKIHEILHLDPDNPEALALKVSVEAERTERDISQWFVMAKEHIASFGFSQARESLQRILQLRPNETRAVQMLSEVNALEQEYVRLRQEKEQLYQAAVEAEQRGDVSAALSKLERVLKLDQRAPHDTSGPLPAYRSLYDKVRSEYENLQRAHTEAKRNLDSGDFAAALALCEEYLAKYPGHALFQALRIDVEEKRRQALSAKIVETERRMEAEPDLQRRVAMLEEIARDNPGVPHFEQLLHRTREKCNLVEAIVVRARTHEQQEQYNEALSQWEILRTIYPRYPGLDLEVGQAVRHRDLQILAEAKNQWVERITERTALYDWQSALNLLAKAQEEHPADRELAELEQLARAGLERSTEAAHLLQEGKRQCEAGLYEEGIGTLERAVSMDARNPALRTALLQALLEGARRKIDSDPVSARSLVGKLLEHEPDNPLAKGLLDLLDDRRRSEFVNAQLSAARDLQAQGDIPGALKIVEQALASHPAEPRLQQLRNVLTSDLGGAAFSLPALRSGSQREAPTEPRPPASSPPSPRTDAAPPAPTGPLELPPARPNQPPARRFALAAYRKPLIAAAAGLLVLSLGITTYSFRRKPAVALATEATIEITTSPPGSILSVNGKEVGPAQSRMHLRLPPGQARIEASLPGYSTAHAEVTLKAGSTTPLSLVLDPSLVLRLAVPSDAQVSVDSEKPVPVSDGQFLREFPLGHHAVTIAAGKGGVLAFQFDVTPSGPAVLTVQPESHDLFGILVSSFGPNARLYASKSPLKVKVDGGAVSEFGAGGLDLPATGTNHLLDIDDGKEHRTKTVEYSAGRVLTAILDADPNTGTLLVQTGQDDATVIILAGHKEIRRGQSKGGLYRLSNLNAATYTVRVEKADYEADPIEQQVKVQKGQDTAVAVTLRPGVHPASARILLTPGSELSLDGRSLGVISADSFTAGNLRPGPHTFRAEKGREFLSTERTLQLTDGQIAELDLRLSPALVPLDFKKNPAGSNVTITRAGETGSRKLNGTHAELPEGDYTFLAEAPGYTQVSWSGHISWSSHALIDLSLMPQTQRATTRSLTMEDWGAGIWTLRDGWYTRNTPGRIFFPQNLGAGTLQFSLYWESGKSPAEWVLHFVDDKNYLRCELAEDNFQVTQFVNGKPAQGMPLKATLPKGKTYTISIEIKPNVITHKLRAADGTWVALPEISGISLDEGRFGFFIPGGQRLFVQHFAFQSDR